MSDLELCGVVKGIEELLSQEECPHSQQELRTILFEERGIDAYFQGDYFHSPSSTLREERAKRDHAWKQLYLVPLFEFHNTRHFVKFVLNFKVPYSKGISK